jgi:putative ABC transport system permease protein
MLRGISSDVRLAVRSFRADPAVSAAAVLTLTLGIGATTAIFSVANGLALRPLPVSNPQDLVTVTSDFALRHGFQAGAGWSHAMWRRLRERADAVDGAFAWVLQRLDLSEGGEMQPVNTLIASGEVFDVLGVHAVAGRTFTVADDVPGGGKDGAVAVISHSLWQRRFAGNRNIVGSPLLIERVPVTIVGVMPAWFTGVDVGQPFDVAIPFGTEAFVRGGRALVNSERALVLTLMLRLKPGQTISAATDAMRSMQAQIVGAGAPAFLQDPFVVVDASRGISDRSRLRQLYLYPLTVLSIIAGIVLVIVCLNIANLLLSRASARRAALGVRVALGASTWRLARQYLVEASALTLVGTAAAMLLAAWASVALVALLPHPGGAVTLDLSVDWRMLAFTTGLAAVAVILFGTLPAMLATQVAPIEALRGAGRNAGGRTTSGLAGGLLITQIALSIVLLAGAVMFVRTLTHLASVPLGLDPDGMIVISVNTGRESASAANTAQLNERLLEAVSRMPGVSRAAGSVWTPVGTGAGGVLTDARGRRPDLSRQASFNFVTPGWFETYRTQLKSGRDFDSRDGPGAPRVAIVNETLHRGLLAEGQTLGGTIHAGPCERDGCTIVGVVEDVVYGQSLRDAAPPTLYVSLAQSAGLAPPNAPFRISLRTTGNPDALTRSLTTRLRSIDANVTFMFRRVQQDINVAVAQERLVAILAGVFGVMALLLTGIGLYGVSSHAATRRRAEIAIRLALGGPPRSVIRALLWKIGVLVVIGAGFGLGATLWLGRFIAPLLYGLQPSDPLAIAGAALTLAVIAYVAGWIPVSRAVRKDPAQVLRKV